MSQGRVSKARRTRGQRPPRAYRDRYWPNPLYLLPAAVILALFIGCQSQQAWATRPVIFAGIVVALASLIAGQLADRKVVKR